MIFRKKGIKNSLYFTHLPRSPLHQIWHSRRDRRFNHLYRIFWWLVKGCGFCGWSKIAISHWQSQSPLTLGWRYCAARDYITLHNSGKWKRTEKGTRHRFHICTCVIFTSINTSKSVFSISSNHGLLWGVCSTDAHKPTYTSGFLGVDRD